jgi:hypothetical protein
VRSGDISLLRGWIASELARRPVGFPQISLPGASYGSTEGGPLNFGGQPKGQLQDAVWARLGITPAAAPERHVVSPDPSGLMLAGDVKDVDITDIMQSINMCKMTGRLTVLQTQRQVEIFFDAGELIHARSLQALYAGGIIDGDEAVLDLFTWSEGAFQFQHMWKATESSVKRKLHALLLEGATLQDYKAALAGKMIALNSTLCVNPASACLSEAEFDARLKNGIPIHQDIQKQVFLKLRKPQRLATLVSELKLSSSTWIPVVFSLSSLDLIASC